jgi:carbamoyltransferase
MNYCSHDPGCALIRSDGNSFDYIFAEEGFLSRRKKSYQFPIRSINYCLDYFDIKLEDIDVFCLDYMDNKRFLRTSDNYRLLVGDFLRSRLKISHNKIKFINSHHLAHANTAFWPSSFDEATVIVVDGLGSEQQTHSIYYMNRSGKSDLLFEQKGIGIGALYTLITSAIGFEAGEEGKTMGLAPYGEKNKKLKINIPNLKGVFSGLNTDYSNQITRCPSNELKFEIKKLTSKKNIYNQYYTKLAYELQKETERCLNHIVKEAIKITKCNNVVFAGGVALNCVANNKIRNLKEVHKFYVQPASGDTGIPIGLAMEGLDKVGIRLNRVFSNKKNQDKISSSFSVDKNPLEKLYKKQMKEIFHKEKILFQIYNENIVSKNISENKIIAFFSEGIELGPRALGHRSFIADARSSIMKNILNKKIKHREGYRPFAPIVLENDFYKYFKSKTTKHPHMLEAVDCKKYSIKNIPAVCHVDKTARVQTINSSTGKIYNLLLAYKKITDQSVLINTSFNDNNEPIVFTQIDAVCTFLRCNADILVLNNKMLFRSDIPNEKLLLKKMLLIQQQTLDMYFDKSIKKLTNIQNNRNNNSLNQFILYNQNLSNYNRTLKMEMKLSNFLLNRNTIRSIFLDKHHFVLIKNFCFTNGIEISSIIPKYKIINDELKSFKYLKNHSDLLCYNMSAYFHNKFCIIKNKSKKNIFCFYNIYDRLIKNHLYNQTNNKSIIDQIKNSYEHNRKMTIKEFFNNL